MATAIETTTTSLEITLTGMDLVEIVASHFGAELPAGDDAGDGVSAKVIQISSDAVVQDLLVATNKIVLEVVDASEETLS